MLADADGGSSQPVAETTSKSGGKVWLLWVWLTPIVAACGTGGGGGLDVSVFEHSEGASLESAEGTAISGGPFQDADLRSITYKNPAGDEVTGIIAYPPDGPSEVGVLVIPGLPESAAQSLEPLALLSCAGATALAIDPPYVREGRMADPLTFDTTDREEQIQFIIEARRAIDVLEETGATRFGVTAVSWGVAIGAMLAGLEDRIDALGLMIGHGGLVERFLPEGEPVGPAVNVSEEQRELWAEAMEPLDAKHFVGDSTANLLFQNGRTDPFVTPESAERLHAEAPSTSDVIWYDVGHEVTPEMIADHFSWLGDQLGLDSGRVNECVSQMPSS
jgi:hypothetical protein